VLIAKVYVRHFAREPLRPSIAGESPISIFRSHVAGCASDRAGSLTTHVSTVNRAGALALDCAPIQVIAFNRTVWPYADCAVLDIVARIVAVGAALSLARVYVVTVESTVVATELTAVFGIVACCYALIAADRSARISLRTLQIAGIVVALKVAIGGIPTGAGFTRCAPGPVVRLAASDGSREDTQRERSNEQTS